MTSLRASPPWRTLARRFVSLPPVRRLGLVGLTVVAMFVAAGVLFATLPDARFHSRLFVYVEPDPEALGIVAPADFKGSGSRSGSGSSSGSDADSDSDADSRGPSLIPRNIWQIFLQPPEPRVLRKPDPKKKKGNQKVWMAKWQKINPHHDYHLVGDDDMASIIEEHLDQNSPLRSVLTGPGNPAMKSDLLRYLILYLEGGVYTDTDTIALQPIDKWVPEKYRDEARIIVGIEFDRLSGKNWRGVHDDLQFCQWTIAAAPGHRLFTTMLTRAMTFLGELYQPSLLHGSTPRLSSTDVLTTTGPSAWTDAVFQELRRMDPTIESLRDLSGLKEERLIGDILILPIDGFGMGQRHSNSTRGKKPPAMARVKHQFRGTWRDF